MFGLRRFLDAGQRLAERFLVSGKEQQGDLLVLGLGGGQVEDIEALELLDVVIGEPGIEPFVQLGQTLV